MICNSCRKAYVCDVFKTLLVTSKDFCINDCEQYEEMLKDAYKKIAENDVLMAVVYDYFTGQIESNTCIVTPEEARRWIVEKMWDLQYI